METEVCEEKRKTFRDIINESNRKNVQNESDESSEVIDLTGLPPHKNKDNRVNFENPP